MTTTASPAGSQRDWRETAALLYEALRQTGTPCGLHKPSEPEDNCPWCGCEAALRAYRATVAMADGGAE